MNYTNASGRRTVDSTPGNAENIVVPHEPDESNSVEANIGAATGNDKISPYVWLITIIASIILVAAGTFVTKKVILKK